MPKGGLNQYVFLLAIQIAKSAKFALALVSRFSLCMSVGVCSKYHPGGQGYDMVTYIDFSFLQTFISARFLVLPPEPMECPAVVPEEVTWTDGSNVTKMTGTLKLWAWRWQMLNHMRVSSSSKIINDEAKCCFTPHEYTRRNMFTPKTFEGSNKEIKMSPRRKCSGWYCLFSLW